MKACTTYQEADEDSPVIGLFWEMFDNWSNEERKLFLRFAWARDRLPFNMGYLNNIALATASRWASFQSVPPPPFRTL